MDPNENGKPDELRTPEESGEKNLEEVMKAAKEMRFRNPGLAARAVAGDEDFRSSLKNLAAAEPYMVWPKVNTGNPEVDRSAPTLADRLRKVLRTRGRKG